MYVRVFCNNMNEYYI